MITTQHDIYRGLTNLLELAQNKQFGIATRIYLADDIGSLLSELTHKQEYCFEKHKIPEEVLERDTAPSLAEAVSAKELASTHIQLAVLHYELREEAMAYVKMPEPGRVDSFALPNFLRIRNERIKGAYRQALKLDADAAIPVEPKEMAVNIYGLVAGDDLRTAISERERARLESSKKYFSQAAASFLKAAKVMDGGLSYAKAGLCLFYAGKYEEAVGYLTCSLEMDPASWEFTTLRAESYLKLGRPQESLDDLLEISDKVQSSELSSSPLDYADYHLILGDVQRQLGRVEEAAEQYSIVLSITNKTPKNERQFEDYLPAIRAEKGLQKLGQQTSTTFEQEAIKEGYPKIMEVMKEYD